MQKILRRFIPAILSVGCLLAGSIMLSIGHAVAEASLGGRSFAAYSNIYYEAFGPLLYGGWCLLAAAILFAVWSLLPIREWEAK
jgi:hypothetical protein